MATGTLKVKNRLGKLVTLHMPAIEKSITYPSDWFKNTKKKTDKPSVSKPNTLTDKNKIYQTFVTSFNEQSLTKDIVNLFLITFFEEYCQIQTKEPWASFGRVFCVKDELTTLTPLGLLTVEETITQVTERGVHIETIKDEQWGVAAAAAFLISRYNEAVYEEHKRKILDMFVKFASRSDNHIVIDQLEVKLDKYEPLSGDKEFKRLIAAFDMFTYNFKDTNFPFKMLRQFTVHAHLKDCQALAAFAYMIKKQSKGLDIVYWFWTEGLAADVDRIYKEGEEMDQVNSYRAWGSMLGIMESSPYSTVRNPHLTLFCHLVCITQGSNWSKKAIFPQDCNPDLLMKNAAVMIYALNVAGILQENYTKEDGTIYVPADEQRVEGEEPKTTDGSDWFRYYADVWGQRVPEQVMNQAKKKWKENADVAPRDRSISKFLLGVCDEKDNERWEEA